MHLVGFVAPLDAQVYLFPKQASPFIGPSPSLPPVSMPSAKESHTSKRHDVTTPQSWQCFHYPLDSSIQLPWRHSLLLTIVLYLVISVRVYIYFH